VDSESLDIKWWARDDLRRTATAFPRENAVVREAIKDTFMYDPRVYSPDIDVDVRNGVVRLSGVVNDLRTRHAAKEDALNTLGVQRVINNIKVRPDVPTDEELKQRVSAKLLRDPLVNRFDIQIDARQGWITLRGEVETSYIKNQAELAARAVKGVVGVLNQLDSRRFWIWMPDRELKAAVEDLLYWSAFIDDENITVVVRNGTITLTGTVASWSEFDEAERKAYQAGAKHVVNQLKVENPSYHGPYGPVMYSPYHTVQLFY
jgi:osmotically-inducible protein OsmY